MFAMICHLGSTDRSSPSIILNHSSYIIPITHVIHNSQSLIIHHTSVGLAEGCAPQAAVRSLLCQELLVQFCLESQLVVVLLQVGLVEVPPRSQFIGYYAGLPLLFAAILDPRDLRQQIHLRMVLLLVLVIPLYGLRFEAGLE